MSKLVSMKYSGLTCRPPDSPVEPCPLAQCRGTGLVVRCGHKRAYQLRLPLKPAELQANPNRELHVLGGYDNALETLEITASGVKKPCPQHAGDLIQVWGGDELESFPAQKVKASVRSDRIAHAFEYIFPERIAPRRYSVEMGLCNGPEGLPATILVYPDLKWSIGLGLNLGRDQRSRSHGGSNEDEHTAWGLFGDVSLRNNGVERDLKPQFRRYMDSSLRFLKLAKTCCDTVAPKLSQIGDVEIQFDYPNLSLHYACELVEEDRSYPVVPMYSLVFKADPLFAVSGEVNILKWVIKMLPGGAVVLEILEQVYDKARHRMGPEAEAKCGIFFRAKGTVSGHARLDRKRRQSQPTAQGQLQGDILMTLEGKIEAKAEVLWVAFDCELSIGAEMGMGLIGEVHRDELGLYLLGRFYWSGITLVHVFHIEGDTKTADYKRKKAKRKGLNNATSTEGQRRKERHVLAERREWPEQPEPLYILRAGQGETE